MIQICRYDLCCGVRLPQNYLNRELFVSEVRSGQVVMAKMKAPEQRDSVPALKLSKSVLVCLNQSV